MNMFEQLSRAAAPHVMSLRERMECIEECLYEILNEIRRGNEESNANVDATFVRVIRKTKLPVGKTELARPKQGEFWMIQRIVSNGVGIKSPNAVLRTNAGALLIALLKETMVDDNPKGSAVLLPGESLEIEPEAEGEYDITIWATRHKIPQRVPNATAGVAQGDDLDIGSPSNRHEPDRYLPDVFPEWQGVDVPERISGPTGEWGGQTPEIPSEPAELQPET